MSIWIVTKICILLYALKCVASESEECEREKRQSSVVFVKTLNSNTILCSGTLLGPYWVLTIYDCFRLLKENLQLTVGTSLGDKIIVNVKKRLLHPLYSTQGIANHVALLLLEKPIKEGSSVKYAKLPHKTIGELARKRKSEAAIENICPTMISSGWEAKDLKSAHFYCDTFQTISIEHCQNLTGITFFHDVICTIRPDNDYSCRENWGSPLMCNDILYGITAFGIGCLRNSVGVPGVYLRIDSTNYLDFIKSSVELRIDSDVAGTFIGPSLKYLITLLICLIIIH